MTIPYILHVHVIPKSVKNQLIGWEEDPAGDRWLKVRIAATPENGAANKELVKFLAKTLSTAPKAITVAGGESSRYKKIKIQGEADFAAIGLPVMA